MKRGRVGLFIAIGFIFILSLAIINASRIPIIGGDTDNWGTILNNFLNTEHNESGQHTNITATDIITTSPWVDVRAFGATGDGVTDDTQAIQAAIDYAQTRVVGVSQAPMVYFPSGDYDINDTIIWKSANLGGIFPNTAVRIYWNGIEDGTAIIKPSGYAGGASFALMTGLNFRPGTTTPRTWLNVTTGTDNFFILEKDHFGTCNGDAIQFSNGWVNLHLTDLRFDGIKGYAIRLRTLSNQNMASFVLDRFTYDSGTGGGDGFLIVDNSEDATNIGDVRVSDGRIEINGAWETDSPQAIFVIKYGSGEARSVGLHASDITYTDASGMTNDSLLYRESPDITGSENFIFQNVRVNYLAKILRGSWVSTFPLPAVPSNGIISWMSAQGDYTFLGATQKYMQVTGISEIISSNVTGDLGSRFAIDAAGKLKWGDGNFSYDTNLYRSANNTLKTDDFFTSVVTGVMTSASAGTVGIFELILDADSGNSVHYGNALVGRLRIDTDATSALSETDYGFNNIMAGPIFTGNGLLDQFAGISSGGTYYGGNITNHQLFRAIRPTNYSSPTKITNLYGLYINNLSGAFITNSYGIYQVGASEINYFGGRIGIGKIPSQKLEVVGNTNITGNLTLGGQLNVVGSTNITGNLTLGGLMQLGRYNTLPTCEAATNASIAANLSGLYYCNSTASWTMIAVG